MLSSFRKTLERLLHDGIHVWVGDAWEFVGQVPGDGGHMSFPAVPVNDPVFWLHHCNVDRLWTVWQRKVTGSGYQPTGTGPANIGHNGDDVMNRFAEPAWFNAPLQQHPIDVDETTGNPLVPDHQLLSHTPDDLSRSHMRSAHVRRHRVWRSFERQP